MYAGSAKTNIYVLIDPQDSEIRYVGKTDQSLSHRLGQHLDDARKGTENNWRTHWLLSLLRKGLRPSIVLVHQVDRVFWQDAEAYWISYYRAIGCRLTNGTVGGDGGNAPHPDIRFKYGLANLGNSYRLGKTHSQETKERLRIAGKRPENVRRLQTLRVGTTDTLATRLRKSEAQKRRNQDPAQRASRSAPLKGKPKSPQTIAKMRAAQQARRARERLDSRS